MSAFDLDAFSLGSKIKFVLKKTNKIIFGTTIENSEL